MKVTSLFVALTTEPDSGGFVHVAHPYCYRCPLGLDHPSRRMVNAARAPWRR
jgi:hypothetical protein